MTVKEIFDLRKQGHIEQAYDEIRRQYATHKGRYTTLCMFWTASDMLRLRLPDQPGEALRIFKALMRMLPNIDDADGRAHTTMTGHALRLAKNCDDVKLLDIVTQYGTAILHPACWQTYTSRTGTLQAPVAKAFVEHAFGELSKAPTLDNALAATKLLELSLAHSPDAPENQHYKTLIYEIINKQS